MPCVSNNRNQSLQRVTVSPQLIPLPHRYSSVVKSKTDLPPLLGWLATLSDMARLRTLRILEHEELSVGELSKSLQLPQSTVSRHLKTLLDGGWIDRRSVGTASMYRLGQNTLSPDAHELWTLTKHQLGSTATLEEDDARLAEVLAQRRVDSKSFFGRMGSEWDQLRQDLFGQKFTLEAMLSLVSPDSVIADLGCGTGNAAEYLASHVKKIIAIDREPSMLEEAKKRLEKYDNIEFLIGELTDLPLADGSIDVATVFLVLHHVPEPAEAILEIARTLSEDGMLMIVDMITHDRDSYRHAMGHLHLGFEESTLRSWSENAGLKGFRYQRLRPDTESKGPGLFVVTMRRH